ncbi:membrane protein [Klebsiella pneumoniae]|uniref:Membrane protein n=1 Tax=Klebsiella pneumoniae TaxID=573 RepID=A0A378FWW4_KLEPN|nr:membrane protein [Klebsiella pneumoniae]
MDGAQWLALFENGAANEVSSSVLFHRACAAYAVAGPRGSTVEQRQSDVTAGRRRLAGEAQGREINATLTMRDNAPWLANVRYLYFNPASASGQNATENVAPQTATRLDFHGWPDLQLRCAECWLWDKNMAASMGMWRSKGYLNALQRPGGSGFGRLTTNGVWVNAPSGVRTSLKGRLHGNKTDAFADFFGVSTPVKDSPFDIDYDLHWRAPPWSPDVASLNGIIKSHLGKGQFTDLSTGHAGQLLRLLSVDALLRKLRFDFSDTFSEGFYFDSITVRHGLRMAYCIPMIRWWMALKRILL